jgi:uncharacterized cupin superfamily protein
MTTTTSYTRSISEPDDVVEFPNGRVETLRVGDTSFSRSVFEPGWRWSTAVRPIAGTESCEYPHLAFMASGTMHVVMDDGTELEAHAGDVLVVAPGHDAWVVGDEPVVVYDFGDDDAGFGKPPG